MDIVYQTNIGFLYDVCQVIICKTAKREGWIGSYVMEEKAVSDLEHIENVLSQFSTVDLSLTVLTMMHPKKGRLLSKIYIDFLKTVSDDWIIDDFENYILSPGFLRKKICDWYLENEEISNKDCLIKLHKNTDIEDSIKLYLYEFFVDPEDYLSTIQKTLQMVIIEMEEYYRGIQDQIVNARNKLTYYDNEQERRLFSISQVWEDEIEKRIISFSMINRYTSMRDECSEKGKGWILLGIEFDVEVEKLGMPIDLIGFGNALGDLNRLNILKEIHKKGEMTLTDLSRRFDLVNAVVLYHLDILRKERLLMQRHEGRKVYYWLNYSRLNQAILAILTEFGGEINENMEKTYFSKNGR